MSAVRRVLVSEYPKYRKHLKALDTESKYLRFGHPIRDEMIDQLCDQFLSASAISGEQFWPMPLPVELRASLDSPVADLANIGERMGGMLVAGLFLKDFIADELPWLHLDIAGPAYNESQPHGYTPVGGTGIALRSLVQLAISATA